MHISNWTLLALAAAAVSAKTVNIIETAFHGDDAKYQKATGRLFDRFDRNEDGFIDKSDLEVFFTGGEDAESHKQEQAKARPFVEEQVFGFDQDGDERVSREEFTNGMKQYGQYGYTLNSTMCDRTREIVKSCKAQLDGNEKMRSTMFGFLCKSGVSSIKSYPVETCVMNARNCNEVADCYDEDDKDRHPENEHDCDDDDEDEHERQVLVPGAASVPAKLQKRGHLAKRDKEGVKIFFWIGMVLLGIASFGSIVLIPFYLIILWVSMKAIDFNKFD